MLSFSEDAFGCFRQPFSVPPATVLFLSSALSAGNLFLRLTEKKKDALPVPECVPLLILSVSVFPLFLAAVFPLHALQLSHSGF